MATPKGGCGFASRRATRRQSSGTLAHLCLQSVVGYTSCRVGGGATICSFCILSINNKSDGEGAMTEAKKLMLSEDMRITLAEAGKLFPGKQLDEVLNRTLADFPNDRELFAFYEIRRRDVPTAFDALLKLQNTGRARRYIETDEDEFREVLNVEVSLLNAIMLALTLVLDIILNMILPRASEGGASLSSIVPVNVPPPTARPYVPTWKRQPQVISHDGLSL